MGRSLDVFGALAAFLAEAPAAALVTVIATRGSTPRETGTRLVVRSDGGFRGTIGGGRFEFEALAEASAAAAEGRDRFFLHRFALGPELGQCCGGVMTIAVEVFSRARRDEVERLAALERSGGFIAVAETAAGAGGLVRRIVAGVADRADAVLGGDGRLTESFGGRCREIVLFGAGHVGRALMLVVAMLPGFRLTWVDNRPGQLPRTLPATVTAVETDDPPAVLARASDGAFVFIMTHDHALDLAILHAALAARRFAHVGLIGSATKRARFVSRLKAAGLEPALAESFACPIGAPGIRSKEPAAIAVAVAAEVLARDEALMAVQDNAAARAAS